MLNIAISVSRFDYAVIGLLASVSAVLGAVYITLRKQMNLLSLKSFLIFLGLTILYFGLLSLSSLWYIMDVRVNYLLVLSFSLGGGILFARVMFVHRDPDTYNTQSDIVLLLFLTFIGMFTYYLGYSYWGEYGLPVELLEDFDIIPKKSYLGVLASSACLGFALPFFVRLSWIFLHHIPRPIYPQWIFPLSKDVPPFDYGDGDPQTKVNLHFSISEDEDGEKFVRLTLIPNEMILGDFIHVYFDTWNENQERSKAMELTDQYGRAHAFRFYAGKNPEDRRARRLDPTRTAAYNKLKSEENIFIVRESRYQ